MKTIPVKIKNLLKKPKNGGRPAKDKKSTVKDKTTNLFFIKPIWDI